MSAAPPIQKSSLSMEVLKGVLYCLWQVVRLPTLAALVVLEPVVNVVLIGAATAIVLVAFVFKFASTLTHFPFWAMLTAAAGCVGILAIYRMLIGWLSR